MGDNDRDLKIMIGLSITAGFATMLATGSLGNFLTGVVGFWGVALIVLGVAGTIIPDRWQRKIRTPGSTHRDQTPR